MWKENKHTMKKSIQIEQFKNVCPVIYMKQNTFTLLVGDTHEYSRKVS